MGKKKINNLEKYGKMMWSGLHWCWIGCNGWILLTGDEL
jgi:hypothetical protein